MLNDAEVANKLVVQKSARGGSIGSALIVTVLLLPFLDKPFHIDDTVFLRIAEKIQQDPLHPYDFKYNWSLTPLSMWKYTQHPPLHSYILAGIGAIVGMSELALHGFYLLFALGCAMLMHRLASRFCDHPFLVTLLSLIAPAFLVSATNLMADIALLFFWLLAIVAIVYAADSSQAPVFWLVGIAASAAAMTKYFGVALVPLTVVYCLTRNRSFAASIRGNTFFKHLVGLLLPVVVLILWGIYAQAEGGGFHPLGAASYALGDKTFSKSLSQVVETLTFLGGCLFWPILLLPIAGRLSRWLAAGVVLLTGFGVLLAATGVVSTKLPTAESLSGPELAGIGVMVLAGATVFCVAIASCRERRDSDSVLLGLWFFGTLAFSAFANWTTNARVILPAVFPATLLVVRWVERLETHRFWLRWMTCSALLTVVASELVVWTDYHFAHAAKSFTEETIPPLIEEGQAVLFSGHWGFQYYMEQAGAQPINFLLQPVRPGDYIVYPTNNSKVRRLRTEVEDVSVHTFPSSLPLHTMSGQAGAGFYSSVFGALPFSFCRDCVLDRFTVVRVRPTGPADAAYRSE